MLLMAVWLGLVKLVGKNGTCSKNLPVCPKLALAVTSIQGWFSLFHGLLFSSISNICVLAENISAHQLNKRSFCCFNIPFFPSYYSRAAVDLNLTAFQKMDDEVISRSMAYPFTIKMCCSGLGKRHSN